MKEFEELPETERLILAEMVSLTEVFEGESKEYPNTKYFPVAQETLEVCLQGSYGKPQDLHSAILSLIGKGILSRDRAVLNDQEFFVLQINDKGAAFLELMK